MSKRRVLFVDDEPNVLAGIRRALRKLTREWDMTFVESGERAVEEMETSRFDVVVSDMLMPGMNGAQLLQKVREIDPSTVRLVLSGHSSRGLILQSVGCAHQFLAKPCEAETLSAAVARCFQLRELLQDEALKSRVAAIESLPVLPTVYNELVELLQDDDCSAKDVGRLFASDIGLSAKVLQLVNSAFFGLSNEVRSTEHAVTLLGIDTVRALVLGVGVFEQFDDGPIGSLSVGRLYEHSARVAVRSQELAKEIGLASTAVSDAMTAGVLHDVGRLLLMGGFRDELKQVLAVADAEELPLHEAEERVLGVSHAELGAYLLGLWGLPDSIVESVAFHHQPARCVATTRSVLTAVHVANALVTSELDGTPPVLDADYLGALDLGSEAAAWCTELTGAAVHA